MTTTEYEHNVVLATGDYNVVGTRPIRPDGVDKVTGRAQYGGDFQASDLLYGKTLRSPHAHARIKSIDTAKAEAYPGVRAVVTAKDFPIMGSDVTMAAGEITLSLKFLRDNVLASDKALYRGHALVGVAAVNAHVAEEALALIEVEYEVLPPVITVLDALKEDAPLLHEEMKTEEFGQKTDRSSNVASHFQHRLGDVEKGFAEADVVIEREFNTKTVHQGYVELHNATAFWNRDGRVTIWCSTQGPFEVRDATAKVLGLKVSDINLVPMEIGGGFGGKFEPYGDPVAALLSKKTGHPVKIIMTRTEEFEGTGPTPGSYIKVKIGATREGKLIAAQAYMAYEAGAYPGSPVGAGALCIFGTYDIPNILIDGLDVVVNKPKTAAYRAPGATNASFASETIIDELAAKLGIDPLEFRLNNAAKEGTRRADSVPHPRIGCIEVIQAMQDHPHWKAPLEGPNRGRGVAVAFWMNFGGPASCTIKVNSDGTIALREGSPDIGGTRASVAMQAAEVLGIAAEDVQPAVVDTDSIGYTNGTGGSSVTFKTGLAAYEAAQEAKRLGTAPKVTAVKERLLAYEATQAISNGAGLLRP
ncbi:MAG: xanthine dehydrogenase family protein molybdopterin-binding subunit [Candidatus Marinimicrobia bacterium]|nr:xanthine dehydrogenase family protein molybdopterin-binding subunit [Candidatus Neomarinimicrobiota bacterium]